MKDTLWILLTILGVSLVIVSTACIALGVQNTRLERYEHIVKCANNHFQRGDDLNKHYPRCHMNNNNPKER